MFKICFFLDQIIPVHNMVAKKHTHKNNVALSDADICCIYLYINELLQKYFAFTQVFVCIWHSRVFA